MTVTVVVSIVLGVLLTEKEINFVMMKFFKVKILKFLNVPKDADSGKMNCTCVHRIR